MNSILSDLADPDKTPWYVSFTKNVGVPAIIALLAFWFLSARVDKKLDSIGDNLVIHIGSTSAGIQDSNTQTTQLLETLKQVQRSLDRVCSNTAKTNQDRNDCFR